VGSAEERDPFIPDDYWDCVTVTREYPKTWQSLPRISHIPIPTVYKQEFSNLPAAGVQHFRYKDGSYTGIKMVMFFTIHGQYRIWTVCYGRFGNVLMVARGLLNAPDQDQCWIREGGYLRLLTPEEVSAVQESWVWVRPEDEERS
jgi:hypothetical protein